ncbi:inner membrane protein [Escherichia coli]|nr:inner membrane protein [Escherichia coli]SQN98783.1 inner membrane protein [Escherichia coli]SQO01317.1 inner membrane protein [Escherichia coli]
MIPDYLTFIRFQDKRNLIYIYAIGLILIGFYWKNAGFTFPSEDIGVVSGILALVLYNFIFDLKAYWAYKCVTKNIDFSWFKKKGRCEQVPDMRSSYSSGAHPRGTS